jgi:hypothetical protein
MDIIKKPVFPTGETGFFRRDSRSSSDLSARYLNISLN